MRAGAKLSEHLLQNLDALLILRHGADADPHPFRQLVGGHGADDDALVHHGFEDGIAITDFDKHEVREARDVFEAHLAELRLQIATAFVSDALGFVLMLLVDQTCERASLGDGVRRSVPCSPRRINPPGCPKGSSYIWPHESTLNLPVRPL